MAYEMRDQLRKGDKLTVISKEAKYHFVPSNPWVAVNWRTREDIEIDLTNRSQSERSTSSVAAKGVYPPKTASSWRTARGSIRLIIVCQPRTCFDEIEGLGPNGYTQSICHVDHAQKRHPRPSRHSAKTPVRSLPAPCKGRRTSGHTTNTPSFSTPICAARGSATACR